MFRNKVFYVTLSVIILFMFFWSFCFAYDSQTTHPNFTDITVEMYNLNTQNKILQSEKYWIKKGSMNEDDGIRSINHFYDPIYNRTWKVGGIEGLIPEVTSKVWVNDQLRQASYDPIFLTSIQFQAKSCLESTANQTYNRAIYEYIKGNKKEAFYALGHVLHLLQDLTSVPHTRADVHIIGDDVSSYEIRSSQKSKNDFVDLFNKLKNHSISKRNTIGDYFYNVALYTNNNFYSDDTIMSYEYKKPEIFQQKAVDLTSGTDKYYVLGWDSDTKNVYKLAKYIGRDWKITDLSNIYGLKDPLVFEDYWSRLSKKAVLEGAGLIDLFFKDVENKKNDKEFLIMMEQKHGMKFFENIIGDVKQLGVYMASLFDKHPEDIIIQPPNTSTTAATITTTTETPTTKFVTNSSTQTTKYNTTTTKKNVTTTTKKLTTTTTKKTTTTTKKATTTTTKKPTSSGGGGSTVLTSKCYNTANGSTLDNSNKKVILNEIAWMGSLNNFSDEWIELKNISSEAVNISRWEIINGNQSIKIIIPDGVILNSQEMYLLERTDDNTVLHVKKDLIYVGAIRNENEEIKLFDNNCGLVDLVSSGSKWPAGDSDNKRTMERRSDFSWYTSSANCINGICGTPKSENSAFLDIYNTSVSTTTTTTTTQPDSTTTTTTSTTLPTTTTTTIPVEMGELKKIVFSEIKIDGENADDEFIELYNPLSEEIDLTGWSIKQKTSDINNLVSDEFLINKLIPANGYFLIVNKQVDKYTGQISSDTTFNSESYSLVNNQALILYDNFGREIDRVGWGEERIVDGDCETDCLNNLDNNKSWERKANENSTVDTMESGIDKLAGNSYDSDNNLNDFIVRNNPDPQNSQSLTEPREDEVDDLSDIGDGFKIKNFNFYYLNNKHERAFIEFDIDQYPFWNVSEENDDKWRAMVFYLNSSDGKDSVLSRERDSNNIGYLGWQAAGKDNQVLLIQYDLCQGGTNNSSFASSLILPYTDNTLDNSFICGDGRVGDFYGAPNAIAYNYNLNSNHVKLEIIGVLGPEYQKITNIKEWFKEGDYITIGFYKGIEGHSSVYLDLTELIFNDTTQRFIAIDNGKTIESPKNLSVVYDSDNYKYNLTWDKINDEEGINYMVCISDLDYNFNGSYCNSYNIVWNGEKWSKSFDISHIPFSSEKVYFVVRAINQEYELQSEFSDVVDADIYEMPKRIDEYISNVNWTIKNGKMYLELDVDRVGKFQINEKISDYIYEFVTAWDFRGDVEVNTVPNSTVDMLIGTIHNSGCQSNNNNSQLFPLGDGSLTTTGHKELLVKYLSHPLLKDKYIYNADGLTLEDLQKLVKSESNPDGILNSLSDMVLTLNYGVRYQPYCGYWMSDKNFVTFTSETNQVANQIRYNFNFPE